MIAVIADDLTGAAELAGISIDFGINTVLDIDNDHSRTADVLVFSTDSRSQNIQDALLVTGKVTDKVNRLQPAFIFKKVDSVLRGYVIDELKLQMQLLGKKRALLLPANPSLGRTIVKGDYYVDGQPIHKTAFQRDPDFPIRTASVKSMLHAEGASDVHVISIGQPLPEEGIVVGAVEKDADIHYWLEYLNNDTLLAGGGDTYIALLSREHHNVGHIAMPLQRPHLYVSGTSYGKSVSFIYDQYNAGGAVHYIPASYINRPDEPIAYWIEKVVQQLEKDHHAIIAVDPRTQIPSFVTPASMRKIMAILVKNVLDKISIEELFVEGGSSAAAIIKELGIPYLQTIGALQRGVVKLKPKDASYIFTVKPGSYDLPEQVVNEYSVH